MKPKALHDFLFKLYDYADYLADQIQPGNFDNNNYFLSLIYIEDMMNTYGRGLLSTSSSEIELDSHVVLAEAHQRIDLLRSRIQLLSQTFNFDEALKNKTEKLLRDWQHKTE